MRPFIALAVYLLVHSSIALAATRHRADHSLAGMTRTALTAATMFARATANAPTGCALDNPVPITEGRLRRKRPAPLPPRRCIQPTSSCCKARPRALGP